MTIVDLACGFAESHKSSRIPESVGVDFNFEYGIPNTDNPIIGDVTQIPIRDHVASYVQANAILEHLLKPQLCMIEMRRIMKPNAPGSILIPTDAYNVPQVLKRFIKEFPFSFLWTVKKCVQFHTIWKLPGMAHISQVNIEDVEKWFKVDRRKIKRRRRVHKWFVHIAPFTLLVWWGFVRRLTVDEAEELVIPISR